MRPVLFIVCFTLGVTLMMLSSAKTPRPASAAGPNSVESITTSQAERDSDGFHVKGPSLAVAPSRYTGRWRTSQTQQPIAKKEVAKTTVETEAAEAAADALPVTVRDAAPTVAPPKLTPLPSDPIPNYDDYPPAVADAGPDQVVWAGSARVTLHGKATDGEPARFLWTQADGPAVRLEHDTAAQTTLIGLSAYYGTSWEPVDLEFTFTVVDTLGRESRDRTWVRLIPAPDLVVSALKSDKSWSDKYFEVMHSVTLPHFEVWVRDPNGPVATFMVESAMPLSFDVVEAGDFEMWDSEEDGRHLYQFDVYQTGDEPRTKLEFLAQTIDEIPAVVRLGVDWYGD